MSLMDNWLWGANKMSSVVSLIASDPEIWQLKLNKQRKQSFKWQMVWTETTRVSWKCLPFWYYSFGAWGGGSFNHSINQTHDFWLVSERLQSLCEKVWTGRVDTFSAFCTFTPGFLPAEPKLPQFMHGNYAEFPLDFSAFMINAGLLTSHNHSENNDSFLL